MKDLTYEQAVEAHERGEKVEFRLPNREKWWTLGVEPVWGALRGSEFRLAKPASGPCEGCNGTGRVTLIGIPRTCSMCSGRGAPIEVIHPQPADPYAHLKAAQAEGKVIQVWAHEINDDQSKVYRDEPNPTWGLPVDYYRIKPDELKIEAGKPRIYVASKTKHAEAWRMLRAMGHNIIASWIDEAGEGESASYTDLASRCIQEATSADFTILYSEPGDILKGALIEVGAALAAGKQVRNVYGCDSISRVFKEHANWREYPSIADAANGTDAPAPYDNWDKVPAWANWQAMDSNGEWGFYEESPEQTGVFWVRPIGSGDGFGSVPKRLYPTNFTGDWTQSLQPRPGHP